MTDEQRLVAGSDSTPARATFALPCGAEGIVDEQDLPVIFGRRWRSRQGKNTLYIFTTERVPGSEKYRAVHLHRLLTQATDGQLVDHENGNGLDNRRSNLRTCSTYENGRHKVLYVARKRIADGFIGVHWNARRQKWTAQIGAGAPDERGRSRRISLGNHAEPEEAARLYDAAAWHFFGEFAALNFPDETPSAFAYRGRDYSKTKLPTGELHHAATITREIASAVKADLSDGLSTAEIRVKHGVNRTIINAIRKGRTWRDA